MRSYTTLNWISMRSRHSFYRFLPCKYDELWLIIPLVKDLGFYDNLFNAMKKLRSLRLCTILKFPRPLRSKVSKKELDCVGQQIVVFYMEQWLKLTQIGQDAPSYLHLVIYMSISSDAQSHFFETDMVQSLIMMKNAAHLKVFERFYSCSLIQSFKIWFSDLYNGQAIGFKVIN